MQLVSAMEAPPASPCFAFWASEEAHHLPLKEKNHRRQPFKISSCQNFTKNQGLSVLQLMHKIIILQKHRYPGVTVFLLIYLAVRNGQFSALNLKKTVTLRFHVLDDAQEPFESFFFLLIEVGGGTITLGTLIQKYCDCGH